MYNVVNQISTTEMYIKQMLKINEILENSRKKNDTVVFELFIVCMLFFFQNFI